MPKTDEWIKKVWYIHIQWNITQPLKRTKCLPFVATWMDFEGIILSEISQTEKDSIARYHLYVESKKYNKLVDMKKKNKVADSDCFCSITPWYPTLCDPISCSIPGFPVL